MPRFKEPAQLHNHSKYSLLDAVPSPEEWVGWCLESGTPALAITDHGTAISMFDALKCKTFIENYNKNKIEELTEKYTDENINTLEPTLEFKKKWQKDNKAAIDAYVNASYTPYKTDAVTLIPAVELYVKLNAEDKSHYHITAWAEAQRDIITS